MLANTWVKCLLTVLMSFSDSLEEKESPMETY